VHFFGPVSPEQLLVPLSAANVFVLATRYEGWANVLLEAMACGLPVVATDVGGNRQVVSHAGLGRIVPFGDADALVGALQESLHIDWDRRVIRGHAESNSWEQRIPQVVDVFDRLLAPRSLQSTREMRLVATDESQAGQRAFKAEHKKRHEEEESPVEAHHAR
jgi:teichuronic acid biosynthesis glycosyltransferase TuaC